MLTIIFLITVVIRGSCIRQFSVINQIVHFITFLCTYYYTCAWKCKRTWEYRYE